jgi:hypothetical protein
VSWEVRRKEMMRDEIQKNLKFEMNGETEREKKVKSV